MAEEGCKRKLAAILSADFEGYSLLMGEGKTKTKRCSAKNDSKISFAKTPMQEQARF